MSAAYGMGPVREMLIALRLEQYAEAFEEEGFDDLPYLCSLDAASLAEVASTVNMKPGHAMKLKTMLPAYLKT